MYFEEYFRTQVSELRPVTVEDIKSFEKEGKIYIDTERDLTISISDVDLQNGSPKLGDMIARNPKNKHDQWLIAEDYFKNNFIKK